MICDPPTTNQPPGSDFTPVLLDQPPNAPIKEYSAKEKFCWQFFYLSYSTRIQMEV